MKKQIKSRDSEERDKNESIKSRSENGENLFSRWNIVLNKR